MFQTAVDRLNPSQREYWNRLRGQATGQWPRDLVIYMNRRQIHNGEDMMEAIAEWVIEGSERGS